MNLRRRFGHLRMIGSDALEQFGHAMQVGARGDADGDLVSRLVAVGSPTEVLRTFDSAQFLRRPAKDRQTILD